VLNHLLPIKELHTLDISGHEWSRSQAQNETVILQEIPYKQHHAVDKGKRIWNLEGEEIISTKMFSTKMFTPI
jgi:hypothetical protein